MAARLFRWLCLLSITFVLTAGARAAPADTQPPVRWTLAASGESARAGQRATAHLQATIKPGWHVYALNQGPGGPVAMRISLPPQGFAMDGDIDSPNPQSGFDPSFGIEVRYYEDEVAFTLHLKNGSQAASEASKVFVDVLYQACTREMCMPPEVVHLSAVVSR